MASSSTNVYTTSARTLALVQSIQFIRASNVVVAVHGSRPNTKLNIFFDGILINQYCGPIAPGNNVAALVGNTPVLASIPVNASVISDSHGEATFLFKIPANTFQTGEKTVVVTEVLDISLLSIQGTMYGSASATYTTKGTLETYQRITTTHYDTTVVEDMVIPFRRDPLAQSFFTYGVKGGIFVTGIELFFLSKDENLPIRVELRGMNQGLPLELNRNNPDLVSTLVPSQINTCTPAELLANARLDTSQAGKPLGTKFRFNPPVYLPEDADYCFVVFSNSNKYHIYTSKLGEKSYENGFNIMEQPFAGCLFKSENNFTWTPEQAEDIKFNIYKANFGVGSGSPRFVADQVITAMPGTAFYTTTGSPLVIYTSESKHGLIVGDKISITALAITGASYNGLTAASMTGDFTVVSVIDDHKLTFNATIPATSTGPISNGGYLNNLVIRNPGAGYTSTPTIGISRASGDTTGTGASATVTAMDNGKISAISFTNGSGYTLPPVVTVSGTGGADLQVVFDVKFNVSTNVPYSIISPQIVASLAGTSTIDGVVHTMDDSYHRTADQNFNPSAYTIFDRERKLGSRINESAYGIGDSLYADVTLTTDNPNVSPVIDMRTQPKLLLASYKLNNQSNDETLLINGVANTNPSGSLTLGTYTVAAPGCVYNLIIGSGYGTTPPTITIVPASNDLTGSGATATCTVVAGCVNTVTITNVGSGYTQTPHIIFSNSPSGITATASVALTQFNSEIGGLLGVVGTAQSRYLTKKVTLTTISTSIRAYAQIDSSTETSVDMYIRTSVSGNNAKHTDSPWQLLLCDTPRNKSGVKGMYFEYEFVKDGMTPFDVYDLKFVMSSTNVARAPCIGNYRVIVSA